MDTPTVDIIPPHLRRAAEAITGSTDLNALTFDQLESGLADTIEHKAVAFWVKADLCALAWLLAGDASTSKLASASGYSGQSVRRWRHLGFMFPPSCRYPDVGISLYSTAAQSENPEVTLRLAVDRGWKARQLRQWLRDEPLTTKRELYHERLDLPPDAPGRALAATTHQLANPLMHALARAREEGDLSTLALTVTLQATVGVGEREKRGEALADTPAQQIVEAARVPLP